jgi:ribonuclease HII
MNHPTLKEEKLLWKRGIKRVAGLDEAGRGPLAGPVTAAAVMIKNFKSQHPTSKKHVLDFNYLDLIGHWNLGFRILLEEVNDSKKLSAKKREELYDLIIKNKNIEWGVGIVSEKMIDKINIKNASELAMVKALKHLKSKFQNPNFKIDYLLIDGNSVKNLNLKSYNLKLIVGGDAKVFSVAAASILAKVTRDRIMQKYHKKYPQYRFDLHKGYPTKLHCQLLSQHGACSIHRRSFSPVKKVI